MFFPCILIIYMWNSGTWLHRKYHFWNFTSQILEKFCGRHIFSLFLTKHLPSFYCFGMGLTPSWCWIFLFNQLTLLLFILLKCCVTVTSEKVNATKNVSISDRINEHVLMCEPWKMLKVKPLRLTKVYQKSQPM